MFLWLYWLKIYCGKNELINNINMTLPYNITDLTALEMYIYTSRCENLSTLIREFGENGELDLRCIDPELNLMVINPTSCELESFYVDKIALAEGRIRFYDGVDWMDAAEFVDSDFGYLHNEIVHYFQATKNLEVEPIAVSALFGKWAVRQYEEFQDPDSELHEEYETLEEALNDDREIYLYRYAEFKTPAEKFAYLKGIEDRDGWSEFVILDERLNLD